MADAVSGVARAMAPEPRHTAVVRTTHWLTAVAFAALLVSGTFILTSHPRFYWGETGNVGMRPLFTIPIPASRASVPTGYGYVLPDRNGWSRSLHFQAAWLVVLTGLVYAAAGLRSGHFARDLRPRGHPFRRGGDPWTYDPLQRLTYAVVVFVLFPVAIWTGLAMSPGFVAAFPATVTVWGGQQSARTIHFFVSAALAGFVAGHVVMVAISGFGARMRGMITGRVGREGR